MARIKVLVMILSAWLATTMLIDFMIMPGAFRTLQDVDLASRLGLLIFSKYNVWEFIFSLISLALLYFVWKKFKVKLLGIMIIISAVISFSYLVFFTPKISSLREMRLANKDVNETRYFELKSELMVYHRLYVGLDTAKIFLLTAALVLAISAKARRT